MYLYKSSDGLASSDNFDFISQYNRILIENNLKEKKFIEELRKKGIKALRADDGWVDRYKNIVLLDYCDFNDNASEGDKIALIHINTYRIVKLLKIQRYCWHGKPFHFFEDCEINIKLVDK